MAIKPTMSHTTKSMCTTKEQKALLFLNLLNLQQNLAPNLMGLVFAAPPPLPTPTPVCPASGRRRAPLCEDRSGSSETGEVLWFHGQPETMLAPPESVMAAGGRLAPPTADNKIPRLHAPPPPPPVHVGVGCWSPRLLDKGSAYALARQPSGRPVTPHTNNPPPPSETGHSTSGGGGGVDAALWLEPAAHTPTRAQLAGPPQKQTRNIPVFNEVGRWRQGMGGWGGLSQG